MTERTEDRDNVVSVLLVDDRRENLVALKAILSSTGYRLVEARSGEDALRRLLEEEFAVVLLDVLMPNMSGFEVAAAMKERERTAQVPIIFLTAQASDVDLVSKGYRVGAVDYLVKPLVPEMVRSKVAVFAQLFQQRRHIERQSALLVAAEREAHELRMAEVRLLGERREQRMLAEFKGTLDAVLDAVLIIDPRRLNFLYVNQGARALWGYEGEELMAMRPFELMVEHDDETRFRKLLEPLWSKNEKSIMVETRCRRRDAVEIPVEISFQIVPLNGDHLISIARDITDRKRAERERERLYGEALTAVRARDEFLSIASHELRTPLSSLKLQLELLLQAPPPASRAQKAEDQIEGKLQRAVRQVDRLSALIAELMDVSRISSGSLQLEPEPIDLADLCRDVVGRLKDVAVKAGCEIVLSPAGNVRGEWDRLRMEQVVTNLISNALKFGAGKPVEVQVTRNGGRVRLEVRDRGIGIPREDVERIFRRYERGVRDRAFGGLGLGLYIVRQIVTAHGGTIGVDSQVGEGATFAVELPLRRPDERFGGARAASPTDEGEARGATDEMHPGRRG